MGLLGLAHGASHFYQLALPPLFPLINAGEGFSYTALGLLTGIFFTVSAVCQPVAGFLVDRMGARALLLAGLALMSVSVALMGLLPYYPVLLVLSVTAAIGNSVFHPCDYSIMNATVSERRIARAFSIHMLGGYGGFTLAPLVMATAGVLIGWQAAMILAGLLGLLLLTALFIGSYDFRDSTHERPAPGTPSKPSDIGVLLQGPVPLFWCLFAVIAMGQMGLMSILPTLLKEIYAFDLETGGSFVSVLVFAVMIGILLGGNLADHYGKPGLLVTSCYLLAAVLALAVWKLDLEALWLYTIFAVTGFVYGVAFPSREMLVRSACPKGASGRVFAFIYSGMDIGAAVTPVLFGLLVDLEMARSAFLCVAGLWMAAIILIILSDVTTRKHTWPETAAIPRKENKR